MQEQEVRYFLDPCMVPFTFKINVGDGYAWNLYFFVNHNLI